MTNRTNGWKLIGRKGDDYYFADSVFSHRDDLYGVTGSIVRPVSPEEYEWASDRENVAERLHEVWACTADREDYDSDAEFDAAFEQFVDNAIQYDGIDHLMFDESDGDYASNSFDELGIEHKTTDCSGGGRIFGSNNFDEVFDRDALIAIEAYEAGAASREYADRMIFGK